jgi:serine/threonine-protein kinase
MSRRPDEDDLDRGWVTPAPEPRRYPEPSTVLLGKYKVESLIGEGGMSAVIKARHLELDEMVAIKCLLPEMMARKDIVARFVREAKAAVKLKGEHVARVHDVGRLENGIPFIVMEYLDGADLSAIIKHYGAQELTIAVDLIMQACEALAEAHSYGIIHRDIKASNFFVSQPDGQAPNLKVLDFGIATAPEGASDLTSTQSVIGTPAYMAPEQMRSSRTVDARSDIWSMGVVLYELLEGARPFRSEVYSELCLKVGMDPPHAMENPVVPDALRDVVLRCLEKQVEKRYQSVAELAFDLMPFASDPVQARAIVEQCARLLGRRGSRMIPVVRGQTGAGAEPKTPSEDRYRDSGPIETDSGPIKRLTPRSGQLAAAIPDHAPKTPISISGVLPKPSTVLGRPTPTDGGKPKTPTSVNKAKGEISESIARPVWRSRRGLYASATVALLALGGAGVYAMATRDRGRPAPVVPAAPEVPRAPETPAPPPVTPPVTPPIRPTLEVKAPPRAPATPFELPSLFVFEAAPTTAAIAPVEPVETKKPARRTKLTTKKPPPKVETPKSDPYGRR